MSAIAEKMGIEPMREALLRFFRPGEVVDEQQLEELLRWRLQDFGPEPEDGYVSAVPLVVVCGCGRSGTTLTRVILDTHPELYAGPESLLFLPVPIDPSELAWKFDLERETVDELEAATGGRAELVERFAGLVCRRNSKRLWVDKTARNVHRLGYILSHFPNVRIVHVMRDPRDVVASLKTHRKWRIVDGHRVPTGYCMPVELCVERYQRVMDDWWPFRGRPEALNIRYEDLVLRTEQVVRDMCAFIGVEFVPEMLEFHTTRSDTRDFRKFPQNAEAARPVSPASIGRHRHGLTGEELAFVENHLAVYLTEYGYDRPRAAAAMALLTEHRPTPDDLRIVGYAEVAEAIGRDPTLVKTWTREALRIHHEGTFLQPQKTYLVTSANPYDRIIALPAALQGDQPALGIKWIGSHSGNVRRGRQRAQAVIILNDPITHAARVVMDGTLISSLRTLAISLIALDQFAPRPRLVGILGMGKLGRMHAQVLGDLYPSVEEIRCCSRRARFDDLLADPRVRRCGTFEEVAAGAEVLVTASAATAPYVAEHHLGDACRLIVNLSLMDCDAEVIANSAHIVVDDWDQNVKADRVFRRGVERGLYGRDRVVELGAVLFGPRRAYEGRVFVNPLGMGLEDVYVAARVARRLGIYP